MSTQEVGQIFGEGSGPANAMLRSPTVIIASIGLWGMNVYFFRLFKINYVKVLNADLVKEQRELKGLAEDYENGDADDSSLSKEDQEPLVRAASTIPQGNRITEGKLLCLSVLLLCLLHLTTYIWMNVLGRGTIGAVFCFYGAVSFAIIFPLPSTRWLRISTVLVLQRAFELVHPRCSCFFMPANGPRPIPFIDVFFADAMCSFSKVFFDWGMLWHLASHYGHPVPKSTHNILIPSFFAAIPYLIRARQCLIMHRVGLIKHDPKRYQHILNAIKYATSIFPICLSAYQQTLSSDHEHAMVEYYLIALLVVNSFYSLLWDIVMDWGMCSDPAAIMEHTCVGAPEQLKAPSCGHAILRPRLRFGLLASTGILVGDAFLRFAWTLRFHQTMFPTKDHFVLFTQFLEVFRRAIWNLLRVEWENLKHQKERSTIDEVDDEELPFISKPPIGIQMAPVMTHRS